MILSILFPAVLEGGATVGLNLVNSLVTTESPFWAFLTKCTLEYHFLNSLNALE